MMKDEEIIRTFIRLAGDNRVKAVDESLYDSIKEKTDLMIEENPEITMDDIMEELIGSVRESAKYLLKSKDIVDSIDSFMNQVLNQENYEDLEFQSLGELLKNHLVSSMLENSLEVSKKAILESWNGRKKTE